MTDGTSEFLDRSVPQYLVHAPFSLCLRELNRLVAMLEFERDFGRLRDSVLDVGCGDGFWWTFLERKGRQICGVDISQREIEQAERIFDRAALIDVSKAVPFNGIEFEDIIGNCSLEHVPDIDAALRNLRRAAAADARLVMFVPTPTWALQGRVQRILMRFAPRFGMMFAGALNGFFQHWHLYHHTVWSSILRSNGWDVHSVRGLGGKRSEFLFRLFLPSGLVAFLAKALIGRYPNELLRFLPPRLVSPLTALIKSSLQSPLVDPDDEGAYEYMIVARAGDVRAA
jgi:SAM-dependent methyltransferase